MLRNREHVIGLCLVVSSLFVQVANSQTSPKYVSNRAVPIAAPIAPAGTIPTPMEMLPAVAPIFVENSSTSSSLMLVNNSAIPAGAQITVRDLAGRQIVSVHRSLAPHEQHEMQIQSILSHSINPPTVGSISVSQDSELKGMTVASQLLITGGQRLSPIYIDEELAMPGIDGSSTLRGIADAAQGPALLAINSNVGWAQHVTVDCLLTGGSKKTAAFTLSSFATLLVAGCSGQTITDFSAFEKSIGSSSGEVAQAYEINTDGGDGTIAAFGLSPHYHGQDLVFSGITFVDPKKENSPNTVFDGIPVGTQQTLPDGIYKPRLWLGNFAASPAHVTVSLATTGENGVSSSVAHRVLGHFTIGPRRVMELPLSSANADSGLLQSAIVESDRRPGDVLGKVVSRSDGTLYEIELLGKDELDENNGGIHPWSVQGDSQSHLLLFDYNSKPRVFDVGVSNGLIVWEKKYTLAPYETREISLNELIVDQVKDEKGQVLSPSRSTGAVNWMVPDSGEGTGRLMVTSHSRALARNFSCGTFIVACDLSVWASSAYISVNQSVTSEFVSSPGFCDEWSPAQCTGGSSVSSGSANFNWGLGPTSVMEFNAPSDQYSQYVDVYATGGGTGSASVEVSAGGCSVGGGTSAQSLALGSLTLSPSPLKIGSNSTFSLTGGGFPPNCADITWHLPVGITVYCSGTTSKLITGSMSANTSAVPSINNMYITVQYATSNTIAIPISN